jgi:hypothetical protein
MVVIAYNVLLAAKIAYPLFFATKQPAATI